MIPHTTTNSGLHPFVAQRVLARFARPGLRALDLGSGPGAMAERLASLGCTVTAADRDVSGYQASPPARAVDFDQTDFASALGAGQFDLVTAIEVIEHVESPIGFLKNVARLLSPAGLAVITTPNVDSLPARVKFLLAGKIRTMDEYGEPTHICPIFCDLLQRQFLPRAGLRLKEHLFFPPDGFQLSRRPLALLFRAVATVLPGYALLGDNHVFVLEHSS